MVNALYSLYKGVEKKFDVVTNQNYLATEHTNEMANSAVTGLFKNQLNAVTIQLTETIKSEFGDQLDHEKLQIMMTQFLASQDIDSQVAEILKNGKKSKGSKKPREPKEVDPDTLCQARVWGDGSTNTQCSRVKIDGGCYCTLHGKQAALTEKPCQVDDNGKRFGLFCGRIDDWQDDEEGVLPFKDNDGFVRIDWTSDEMKSRIKDEIDNGNAKRPTSGIGAKKKSTKKSTKKKTTAPVIVDESAPEPTQAEIQSANELADLLAEPEVPHTDTNQVEVVKEEEEEEDDDAMEVDHREFNGITYYVNEANGNIHHLDCDEDDAHYGEIIGTWTEDGPQIKDEWKNKNN